MVWSRESCLPGALKETKFSGCRVRRSSPPSKKMDRFSTTIVSQCINDLLGAESISLGVLFLAFHL